MSFTWVSHLADGALALDAADVVALALGATQSPSPAAAQSSTTHERGRRTLIRCAMRPSPSDNLTGAALVRYQGSIANACQKLPFARLPRAAPERLTALAIVLKVVGACCVSAATRRTVAIL